MIDDIRKDNEEEARREEARRQEEENYRHNAAMQRIAEQEARDARAHNRQKKKEDSENTMHMKRPFVFAKVVPMHQNALALSKVKIPIAPATAPDNSYV